MCLLDYGERIRNERGASCFLILQLYRYPLLLTRKGTDNPMKNGWNQRKSLLPSNNRLNLSLLPL